MIVSKRNLKQRFFSAGLLACSLAACLVLFSPEAEAACSVVADQETYNDGDTVTVTATNDSGGDWAVCIYSGGKLNGGSNLPIGRSMSDSNTTKTASAVVDTSTDYGGWRAVVLEGNGCNSTYTSGALCEAPVNAAGDAAAAEPEEGGETTAGTTTGTATGTTTGDGTTTGTATGTIASISIINPLLSDDFTTLVTSFLQWLLGIAGSIALLMLIYGGVLYISSAGNQQQADQGKKIVTWTLAGLLVILLSWSIIKTVEDIFVN